MKADRDNKHIWKIPAPHKLRLLCWLHFFSYIHYVFYFHFQFSEKQVPLVKNPVCNKLNLWKHKWCPVNKNSLVSIRPHFIVALVTGLCNICFQHFEAAHSQHIYIYKDLAHLLRWTGRIRWQTLILPVLLVLSQPKLSAKMTGTELDFFMQKYF